MQQLRSILHVWFIYLQNSGKALLKGKMNGGDAVNCLKVCRCVVLLNALFLSDSDTQIDLVCFLSFLSCRNKAHQQSNNTLQ